MPIRAITWVAFIASIGCTPPGSGPEGWRLDDGRPVADSDNGTLVVLAMDPAEVFTCAAVRAEWLDWRRVDPRRFRLVFTRAPTPAEARRLRAVRLPLAGTLANGPRSGTPVEVVFRARRVVYADSGVALAGDSQLLARLRTRSLDDIVPGLATPSRNVSRR